MRHLQPEEKREFKELVLRYLDDLHRVAISMCRDRERAEEFVAQAIAKACESFHGLRDRSKAKPWLLHILSNTIRSSFRAQQRHREVALEGDNDDDERFSLFTELSQPFLLWWGNPEREVINKLLDEDIQQAIASLPPEFRLAVVLCDVEGMTYQEVATVVQVPVGTVRSRIARGRAILQKKLWQHARDLGIITTQRHRHETNAEAR